MKKQRILVTGGAGFIGSHLVDLLIKQGHTVTVIDDLSGGRTANLNPTAQFFRTDIRRMNSLEPIFAKFRPEIIYHLAANAAENKAQFSPVDITSRNFDGSMKVLTAGIRHGMKRFIFTSSIAVYGALQTPFKENDSPQPEDIYGVTKLAFEQSLRILSEVHGFEYVIVRPHNVYGPRQNMRDPYRNVVTIFMNQLLRNKPFHIYGDGTQQRCFSYIDDIVTSLHESAIQPVSGMIFNVGSDRKYTLNQLADSIIQISGKETTYQYLPERLREVKSAISDHTLSKKYLHYKDQTDLVTGLQKTWDWAVQQGYQKPKYTSLEIDHPAVPENWKV